MNLVPRRPKYANMQEKVSIFGVVKSSNVCLQSLRSVTSLYKNMHLHGNAGSSNEELRGSVQPSPYDYNLIAKVK